MNKLGSGYALLVGERKRNQRFLSDIYVGWGVRGALLRTWGDSTLDPSGQTFVGAEADLTVASANIGVGPQATWRCWMTHGVGSLEQ